MSHVTQYIRDVAQPVLQPDGVDENDLRICSACCCCNSALYLKFPTCIGFSAKGSICCLEFDACLKLGAPCLPCFCCGCKCISPTTCIKVQKQLCCIVSSIALPTDPEVPCMFGLCCFVCYPKAGFCKRQGDITGTPVIIIIERS